MFQPPCSGEWQSACGRCLHFPCSLKFVAWSVQSWDSQTLWMVAAASTNLAGLQNGKNNILNLLYLSMAQQIPWKRQEIAVDNRHVKHNKGSQKWQQLPLVRKPCINPVACWFAPACYDFNLLASLPQHMSVKWSFRSLGPYPKQWQPPAQTPSSKVDPSCVSEIQWNSSLI